MARSLGISYDATLRLTPVSNSSIPPASGPNRPVRCTAGAVLILCLAAAGSATAQVVRGTVIGSISKTPVQGVAVSLLDARDSVVATVRSGRDGAFRLVAPRADTFSVALRAIGYEPMMTTPFALGTSAELKLDFEIARSIVVLDTVDISGRSKFTNVTSGRSQFLEHYRQGRGMFLSGAEISASGKGVVEYVAELPGFADFKGGRAPDVGPTECQGLNVELTGRSATMRTSERTRLSQMALRDDLCSLRDEMGRAVYSSDAPCVTTQVDRIGLVKRVDGKRLVVHRSQRAFVPSAEFFFSEAEAVTPAEVLINFKDVIGVEFYQNPGDIPKNLRIRGSTPEAEVMIAKCAHIQIWTRMAW